MLASPSALNRQPDGRIDECRLAFGRVLDEL